MPNDRIAVLHDTDIGSDIDDAVALAYLLRQPRCELVGVTTVSGVTAQRAALADAVCRAAGRTDVPIHAGSPGPLLHGPGQPEVPQYQVIENRPHRKDWPSETAVEFMRATIRARPGEITLLSTGPFTNVALLFALDPEIPGLLKELVSMAGVFWPLPGVTKEWNCLVDPVATAMVLGARPRRHVLYGLDVTTKCVMASAEVRRRFTKDPLPFVRELSEVWFAKNELLTFHDPLAAAAIFNGALCRFSVGEIFSIPDREGKHEGNTSFLERHSGPHTIAATVSPEAFFAEFFSVFR